MLESANKMAVKRMELAFVINASLLKLSSQEITKIWINFCLIVLTILCDIHISETHHWDLVNLIERTICPHFKHKQVDTSSIADCK